MSLTEQILSPLSGTLENLRRADALWQTYRGHAYREQADREKAAIAPVVSEATTPLTAVTWDVVICGGTLGILIGAALSQRGWKVAVLERGKLRGRSQEWNISRHELRVLMDLGLLTAAELEQAIATEYNPARLSFHEGIELYVEDVLNIGVDPVYLLDTLKAKFLAAGGELFEQVEFVEAIVHPNGVEIQVRPDSLPSFQARLLLDAMGHFSPLSRQARGDKKPDAVCLVVGTCAQGFDEDQASQGDLFASFTPIQNQCQYFWEAFPARDGRTTYLFTYVDAHPDRPSLESLFETYLTLLPQYQGVAIDRLQFQRALFGFFPCYRQSPLKPAWDRIVPIGDSSGSQSPLSFGGFGAMIRHLERLTLGIHAALEVDLLDRTALGLLQPYQPSLAVTWLFQRSMSVGMHQTLPPNQINALLSGVFAEMQQLGDPILKPFLQDVVQLSGLSQTMLRVAIAQPLLVAKVIPQVGLLTLLTWLLHYFNLALYTGLYWTGQWLQPWIKRLPPRSRYFADRWLEAWRYGSGNDWQREN